MIKKIMFRIRRFFFGLFQKHKYCKLGKKTFVYKPMLISGKKYISLGSNVFIRNGARIEAITKWKSDLFSPSIFIGDNTCIEQNAHIISNGELKIGANCLISARLFITTCEHQYSDISVPVIEQDLSKNNVFIGDNCFIGMDVKIFPGVTIGKNVIIGANSIVMNDIPDYCVAVGTPAKVIKKYDFEKKEWIKVKGVE